MRTIPLRDVENAVAQACGDINRSMPADALRALRNSARRERSRLGRVVFDEILLNAAAARRSGNALCQDTGLVDIFITLGQEVRFTGGSLHACLNRAVRRAYLLRRLRPSIVADPFDRLNTFSNTPASIHVEIVPGSRASITVLAKGGGSENAGALAMLDPADGWGGVRSFVLETIRSRGIKACPPLVVGVGTGGNFSSVALLAKKALLRPIGSRHSDPAYQIREKDLLSASNRLAIGPMGYGGSITALAVHIAAAPCHIASLPVAVCFQCHSIRRKTIHL